MGQFDVIEEKTAILWDRSTIWASREWLHFQRSKLAEVDAIVHCLCGEGCDDCYGEPHCGCPYCYRPPRNRRRKKTKLKQSIIGIIELEFDTIFVIPSLIYQTCQVTCSVGKVMASFTIIKPNHCFDMKLVLGPKKTRYFCSHCQADICNNCVRSCCSSHKVQFMGSRVHFSCKSPLHRAQK
eukprot:GFUD01060138.1.p1 GENE.GFUD01060138.1~~GFUD01060138.1.p1  ORF type:complete len:182 (+),score=20.90 GFUD01060138.1:112-657(+)